MIGLWGRVKSWVIILLAALVPVAYLIGSLLGRKSAKAKSDVDRLTNAAISIQQAADFYRGMAEYESEIQSSKLHNRDNLVERLRKNGL